jgi:hypothetical protein
MPYTADTVPTHVPPAKAKQWAGAWNGAYRQCVAKGGEKDKCEGLAFGVANALLKEGESGGTMTAKTLVFVEALDLTEAQIDNEAQTVRQRIIRTGRSTNGRVYDAPVLQRAAALFEGVKTFADHPSAGERRDRPERSVRHITGWLDGVEFREDGIYAVRHFTRNQAGTDTWALVRDIVEGAVGKARKTDDGDLIVESIEAVHSVDDVTTPAAGGGFMPLMAGADDLTAQLLGALSFEEFITARPEFVERLKKEWQAVRQTEAVAAALKERDQEHDALVEAQGQVEVQSARVAELEAETAKLRAGLARKGLEVELEKALRKAALPAPIETELRGEIARTEPGRWLEVIERNARLVTALGKQPTRVSGAPRMVTESALPVAASPTGPVNMDAVRTLDDFVEEIRKRQ